MAYFEWILVIAAAAGAAWWVFQRGQARAAKECDRPWRRRAFSKGLAPDEDPARDGSGAIAGHYFHIRFPSADAVDCVTVADSLQAALLEARLGRVWADDGEDGSGLGVLVNDRDLALAVLLDELRTLDAPEGTVLEEFEPEHCQHAVRSE